MECAVEEQTGGLLFCPLEEALLDRTALPNSTCRELLGRSQGEVSLLRRGSLSPLP